jgi:hypothetical protein
MDGAFDMMHYGEWKLRVMSAEVIIRNSAVGVFFSSSTKLRRVCMCVYQYWCSVRSLVHTQCRDMQVT